MTDQPKPSQPSQTAPPAQSQQPPKEVPPAADKAPVSQEAQNGSKLEAETKVAADAKPESQPEASPVSSNGAPIKSATNSENNAPQPAEPPKPESSAPVPSVKPTEKLDISDDPTLPGRPAPVGGVTKVVEPPKSMSFASPVAREKDDTIPPQSNANKVTQRFNDPGPAGQALPGTICPSCGHRNRPGTLICDNCGTSLVGGVKAAMGTRDLVSATEAASTTSEPLMDAAQLNAVESAGGSIFSDDMVLRIEIEGGATPMLVYPKQEIILGRRDPNTGTLPDVDMTAYSGYRMGVSRTHASIRLQDKQLNLSDRGSSNGTFLNGTRLVAHRPYPVKDGDEIRLGQMVLKVYFQSNKPRK